jgi:hypothetical protein
MRRCSLVNLGIIKPSLGKLLLERWVLRLWSRQMIFMKISSKVKRELPSNGFSKKHRGKGFGIDLPIVIMGSEKI